MVDSFMNWLVKLGIDVELVKEDELKESKMKDKDLCISLGGDSSYLKAAGIIDNSS
jgi:hypothetical protein